VSVIRGAGSNRLKRVEINAAGDLVLTDPAAMRALADPARLTLHDQLRREGPSSVAELAESLDLEAGDVETSLVVLEKAGLVERSGERWSVVGKGVFFEIPDDPEGQQAARQLSNTMLLQYVDLPRRWVAECEPQLAVESARAAGLFNARLTMTADELREVQERLEEVLQPYLSRDDPPEGADTVRVLAYLLPRG
jgi:DNA-binding transcriptional ArsR family regulator